jgi:hypothetical protein
VTLRGNYRIVCVLAINTQKFGKNATHKLPKVVLWEFCTMECRRPLTAEFRVSFPAAQCENYDGKTGIGT